MPAAWPAKIWGNPWLDVWWQQGLSSKSLASQKHAIWNMWLHDSFLGLEPSNKESRPRFAHLIHSNKSHPEIQISNKWHSARSLQSRHRSPRSGKGTKKFRSPGVASRHPRIRETHLHVSGNASIAPEAPQTLRKLPSNLQKRPRSKPQSYVKFLLICGSHCPGLDYVCHHVNGQPRWILHEEGQHEDLATTGCRTLMWIHVVCWKTAFVPSGC